MEPLTLILGAVAVAGLGGTWRMRFRAQRAEARVANLAGQLESARHAASHDVLTGLANRRGLEQQAETLLADPQRLPLLAVVVDLDDFKQVNDRFGHAAGDHVLAAVGRRLARQADGGAMARLGGDEFVGLLTGWPADPAAVERVRRRLVAVVAEPIVVDGVSLRINASVGLAPVITPTRLTDALRLADEAMYRAKHLTPSFIHPDIARIAEV